MMDPAITEIKRLGYGNVMLWVLMENKSIIGSGGSMLIAPL